MSSLTALIVDDTLANIVLLEHYLAMVNVRALSATSGKVGYQLACDHQPDMIFMDLLMPVPTWDGYETTRHLKADPLTAHIPVIAVTAAGDKNASWQAGCDGFLARPFQANELRAVVDQFLFAKK